MEKTANYDSRRHIRINTETGEQEVYFPMEITDPYLEISAKEQGYEIAWTKLGNRFIRAAMIPCKDHVVIKGKDVFIATPFEKQLNRYHKLMSEKVNLQDREKQEGRCQIPDGKGGMKRCPCRVPNPDYTPYNGETKTLPNKCENCCFEEYRQPHTMIEMSSFEGENENGEPGSFDWISPKDDLADKEYEILVEEFIDFLAKKDPRLAELAKLRIAGYSRTESAKILGEARSTAGDHMARIRELARDFLDSAIIF